MNKKLEILFEILSMNRGSGSELATMKKVEKFIPHVTVTKHYSRNGFMYGYCDVGASNTVFTCHLDTVEQKETGTKPLSYDPNKGQCFSHGNILGADDGAGIAVLIHMINAGIAGRYFFFAGEERGGIGSSFLVDKHAELLDGYNMAIAFDRAGTSDVIVSQSSGECCSRQFAVALCEQLGDKFMPCNGFYTDTAEMVGIVPECTNISVGYYHQHDVNEYQDTIYYEWLCDKVCEVQWEQLPVKRNPMDCNFGSFASNYKINKDDLALDYILAETDEEWALTRIEQEELYEFI